MLEAESALRINAKFLGFGVVAADVSLLDASSQSAEADHNTSFKVSFLGSGVGAPNVSLLDESSPAAEASEEDRGDGGAVVCGVTVHTATGADLRPLFPLAVCSSSDTRAPPSAVVIVVLSTCGS